MANFSYKKTTNVTLKLAGMLDLDSQTIEVDGDAKDIMKMLSDFNGCPVEINVKLKETEELDEPAGFLDEE